VIALHLYAKLSEDARQEVALALLYPAEISNPRRSIHSHKVGQGLGCVGKVFMIENHLRQLLGGEKDDASSGPALQETAGLLEPRSDHEDAISCVLLSVLAEGFEVKGLLSVRLTPTL